MVASLMPLSAAILLPVELGLAVLLWVRARPVVGARATLASVLLGVSIGLSLSSWLTSLIRIEGLETQPAIMVGLGLLFGAETLLHPLAAVATVYVVLSLARRIRLHRDELEQRSFGSGR